MVPSGRQIELRGPESCLWMDRVEKRGVMRERGRGMISSKSLSTLIKGRMEEGNENFQKGKTNKRLSPRSITGPLERRGF